MQTSQNIPAWRRGVTPINGPSALVQVIVSDLLSWKGSELFVADLLRELLKFSAERKEKCK